MIVSPTGVCRQLGALPQTPAGFHPAPIGALPQTPLRVCDPKNPFSMLRIEGAFCLHSPPPLGHNTPMQHDDPSADELDPSPTNPIDWNFARGLARDILADDYDEDVQSFLSELLSPSSQAGEFELQRAATLLLQDEVDFSPELLQLGVQPDEELIELFIACGADVNARNSFGELPLVLAARYAYLDVVDLLLDAGADKAARNAHGQQAADVAATPELVERLLPDDLRSNAPSEATELDATDYLPSSAEDANEPPLPPFVEDADWGEADESFFAPIHDCGCGDCNS